MIRSATGEDLEFLVLHDRQLKKSVLREKIARGEIYILEEDGAPVGWARYNLFCDVAPFLTNLHILEGHRRRGLGRQLMAHWEQQMRDRGFTHCLTSTQADEEAQFFYREIGYSDAGGILLPEQAATEIFLLKSLVDG